MGAAGGREVTVATGARVGRREGWGGGGEEGMGVSVGVWVCEGEDRDDQTVHVGRYGGTAASAWHDQ